jgi:hypothetical protein
MCSAIQAPQLVPSPSFHYIKFKKSGAPRDIVIYCRSHLRSFNITFARLQTSVDRLAEVKLEQWIPINARPSWQRGLHSNGPLTAQRP